MKRITRGAGTQHALRVRHPAADGARRSAAAWSRCVTPSGHSSSYPPHKHDTDNLPVESSLEETYYHRLDPAQGFAFQRVYTDDRSLDEALAVEDHDVVMVPRGYHPVVVPYGYDSYYLNVMAGPTREWHFKNDPAHEWMLTEITEMNDDGSGTVRRRPHRQDPRRQRRPPAGRHGCKYVVDVDAPRPRVARRSSTARRWRASKRRSPTRRSAPS